MAVARNRGIAGFFHHNQTSAPSGDNKLFAGAPALYTLQGPVRTAPCSALRLYNQLDGQQVAANSSINEVGAIVAISDSNDLRVIVFSAADDWLDTTSSRVVLNNNWPHSANKTYRIKKMMVDAVNANPRALWVEMGKPNTATTSQIDLLQKAAEIPEMEWRYTVGASGNIVINTHTTRPAVQYFELVEDSQ